MVKQWNKKELKISESVRNVYIDRRPHQCLQSDGFFYKLHYYYNIYDIIVLQIEVHSRSKRSKELNWSQSQRNCKDTGFKEINTSDMCAPNRNTTDTGMWTNIFRVTISDHADHGN